MSVYRAHPAATRGLVTFTGPLLGKEKEARISEASVFCFPTSYESENFPVVLLEAMRAGVPIVSTRWRGIPEIVEDGVSGILVEPHDPEALVEAVVRVLSQPDERRRMGEAGRRRYEERFTESQYVARLCSALREAAG